MLCTETTDNMRRSGIYKISSTLCPKIYIGSAVCFARRLAIHKLDIKRKKHNQKILNYVRKYGVQTLKFEILEYVDDPQNLIPREQYWLDKLQPYKSAIGFNICKVAGSCLGITMPESQRTATSNRMKNNTLSVGRKHSEAARRLMSEASKRRVWTQESSKKLSAAKKGVPLWQDKPHPALGKPSPLKGRKQSKEFCALQRELKLKNNPMRGKKLSPERINQIKEINSCRVAMVDARGNILKVFESQASATKQLGLSDGAVARVCSGEYKQTKGYRFKKIQ